MAKWKYTIYVGDIFNNDDMEFTDKRDQIVARIKASLIYRQAKNVSDQGIDCDEYFDYEEFVTAVDELAEVEEESEFDNVMYGIYNFFDDYRVWFDIFLMNPPPPPPVYDIPEDF